MSYSSENEVKGLHTVGNPDCEHRSSDRGPTGETPIGSRVWGGIMVRGTADKMRNQMTIYRSDSKLRGAGSR